jgi:hypothetical protein
VGAVVSEVAENGTIKDYVGLILIQKSRIKLYVKYLVKRLDHE